MSPARRWLGRLAAALVAAAALAAAAPALGAPPTVTSATPTGTVRVVDVDVVVTFNIAVTAASMQAPGAVVVQEVTPAGPGPAIAGTSVAAISSTGRSWRLTLPSAAGSSATYRVSLSNIQSVSTSGGTLASYSWTFSTEADGIPPRALTSLAAAAAPGGVALAWDGPPDLDRAGVTILRREGSQVPSPLDPATTIVASVPSPDATALDTTALPGHTYTYAALPYDRDTPPNQGPLTVAPSPVAVPAAPPPSTGPTPDAPVTPTPQPTVPVTTTPKPPTAPRRAKLAPARLLLPKARARLVVGRAIALRWRANPKAAYYNVQVFRGRRKILTTFPTGVREVIPARLLTRPGTYRLLVWSGLGAKRRGRYAPTPWLIKTLQVRPRVPTAAEAR